MQILQPNLLATFPISSELLVRAVHFRSKGTNLNFVIHVLFLHGPQIVIFRCNVRSF